LCADRYSGNDCSQFLWNTCYGISESDISVCSGKGYCIAPDICKCEYGYVGNNCEDISCFGYSTRDTSVCSARGNCTGIDVCVCEEGFTGENCQFVLCGGVPSHDSSVCGGNGVCDTPNSCSCDSGYGGIECGTEMAFCFTHDDCSNGTCSNGWCACTPGYDGPNCEEWYCYGVKYNDPSVCSGNGVCEDPENCDCYGSYSSKNCSVATNDEVNTGSKTPIITSSAKSRKLLLILLILLVLSLCCILFIVAAMLYRWRKYSYTVKLTPEALVFGVSVAKKNHVIPTADYNSNGTGTSSETDSGEFLIHYTSDYVTSQSR
jgi:hypothetical protein